MTRTITFQTLIDFLNLKYPPSLAEEWDKVGIHFGHPDREIKTIMTSLDIRPAVVTEAINNNVDTIVVHHPPIFSSIDRFNLANINIQMYAELIKHEINVFAMHTNVDRAENGMNDWLALELNLNEIHPVGGFEQQNQPHMPRIGKWSKAKTRSEVIDLVKQTFHIEQLTLIEKDAKETYQTVAICGGAGSDFLEDVLLEDADIYITGDVTYHTGHEAYETDLFLIDASHYIEHIFGDKMKEIIQNQQREMDWDVQVFTSQTNTNPFKYA